MSGFDEQRDVVVVGFGAAGAAGAIQAADDGADVLAVDRFEGGGASRKSGGVVYAGGGTELQRRHGFEDDPEAMFAYLRAELGSAVDEPTLRAFCQTSESNLRWLQGLGVPFGEGFFGGKATEPPDGTGLYYSGNEIQRDPSPRPPPRGHVPDGRGRNGRLLFDGLARAAAQRGVRFSPYTRAESLTRDGTGRVTGVVLARLSGNPAVRLAHHGLYRLASLDRRFGPALARLERSASKRVRVAARGGVILAAGGFAFDPDLMATHARAFAGCMPLGTPGDDGAGIRLGREAGADLADLDAVAGLRFTCPPEGFAGGVLVDARGGRICDESLYGAALGRAIAARPGGKAWLIIDARIHAEVRRQLSQAGRLRDQPLAELLSGQRNALVFLHLTGRVNLHLNRARATDLAGLARRCGLPERELIATVEAHDRDLRAGRPDRMGKPEQYRRSLAQGPFYAVACHIPNPLFLAPCFTLGGLVTEGLTARVLDGAGEPIPGLYAVGRSAVGICTGAYFSGLSLADCIFSGRNAGREAAARLTGQASL